jgi:renalase
MAQGRVSRAIVVGAGLSGLAAARRLRRHGVEAVVLERSRGPGGRLATRRIGAATFDHGAQFFTVRTDEFAAQVGEWRERELVRIWNHGFERPDGHPRYAARQGMNALAKDLAAGTSVETGEMAFRLSLDPGEARPIGVMTDDGAIRRADAAIVSCPLPQAFSLLLTTGVDLADGPFHAEYDRTAALLVQLDRPVDLGPSGGLQQPDDVFSFIGDNADKGVSSVPALTFHARPDWSEEHWGLDRSGLEAELRGEAERWLDGAPVVGSQIKRWRFATPRRVWPERCWSAADGRLVVCGDAFAGPRIEAAYLSGIAAADAVLDALGRP